MAGPVRASEPPRPLDVDWAKDGAVAGGALVLWGASELAKGALAPPACRWCEPPALDASARRALAWSSTGSAATASDVLMLAVPAGVVLDDALSPRAAGDLAAAGEDVLLVTEAVAASGVLTQAVKFATARERPYALGGGDRTRDDHLSFWSGHTATAFAAAASGGLVAQLRGYAGWPWVYAAGFAGAAATGYFRMAADKHWLTDVLAGAAAGTAVGLAVPWLHRAGSRARVAVIPGGLAISGEL